MMQYWMGWLMHSRMPKMPVTPVPEAPRCVSEQMKAPTAAPAMPATNGLNLGRLTPKMAGSVMPSRQEMPEGTARALVFSDLVLRATARQAPPWAMLAAEAMGSQ